MYIFVFYWSAAMESVHAISNGTVSSSSGTQVPYGVIFATFMAAMMLGSLLFSHSCSATSSPPQSLPKSSNSADFSVSDLTSYLRLPASPSKVLTLAIIVSSTSLLLPVLLKSENLTFWAFCVFELCIGIYFPSMGAQKGRIVDDGVRANIYGVLRIPLNVFVAVTLTSTVEGDAHRDRVFVFCGALLLAAGLCAGLWLEDGDEEGSELKDTEERVV
jgi:MFS transporter, MFS domain-containing protein family, molybdate-anion transporter